MRTREIRTLPDWAQAGTQEKDNDTLSLLLFIFLIPPSPLHPPPFLPALPASSAALCGVSVEQCLSGRPSQISQQLKQRAVCECVCTCVCLCVCVSAQPGQGRGGGGGFCQPRANRSGESLSGFIGAAGSQHSHVIKLEHTAVMSESEETKECGALSQFFLGICSRAHKHTYRERKRYQTH